MSWNNGFFASERLMIVCAQKLSSLLRLPPSVAVLSAQILFLRLTIPSDLYQSGISVEVNGVEVRISADLEEHARNETAGVKTRKSRHRRDSASSKADQSKDTQFHVHDPGGSRPSHPPTQNIGEDERLSEDLPTTDDVAKSFLQSEPKERKAELEAAIAQSQHIDQSQVLSEDGDGIPDLGVGNAISLPGFLSEFLKGVIDRIEVKIENVVLDLDLKICLPPEGSAPSDESDKSDVVTIRLSVETIVLDGVTSLPTTRARHSSLENLGSDRHYIRRLTIANCTALLISEASLFANLSRSTAPASPDTAPASTMEKSGGKSERSAFSKTGTSPTSSAHTAETHGVEERYHEYSSTDNLRQSFADASSDGDDGPFTASSYQYASGNSKNNGSPFTDSFYSDHGHGHSMLEARADSENVPSLPSNTDAADYRPSSSQGQPPRRPSSTVQPSLTEFASQPTERFLSDSIDDSRATDGAANSSVPRPPADVIAGSCASSSPPSPASDNSSASEDLTQSKIFSHEEAESMYMSAISHASMSKKDKSISMPGNWGSSDSESEDEGRIASFLEEPSSSQHHRTSFMDRHSQKNGFGISRHHKQADPQQSNTFGSSPVHRSLNSITDGQVELKPSTPPAQRRAASSHGSQLSSTNLKASFSIEKRLITVDSIVLELPQPASPPSNIPLEVSKPRPASSSEAPHINFVEPSGNSSESTDIQRFQQSGRPLTIDVGNIEVLGDMALTRMTIIIVQKLDILRKNTPHEKQRDITESPPSKKNHLRVKINKACWKFLDMVKSTAVSSAEKHEPAVDTFSQSSEVLLRAEIDSCLAVHNDPTSPFIFRFSMGKFRFGYAAEDILSFDSGLKMRESTRDILAPIDNDVALTINKINDVTKIDITTLPLHVYLDLRRLDETFGWFGGFSSMLDLGSSVVSTVTVKNAVSKASRPMKTPRGVHFETTETDESGQPTPREMQSKISARIGGLVFDLRGSQTSLRVETTAMKLVSRTEGLGLVVDRLNLSGPYLQPSESDPSIQMKLVNLRVEYLSTPKEADLDRLLGLLSPSKDKYDHDDDILVDTLLRQRRQGGVIRTKVDNLESYISSIAALHCFPALAEDLKKLSTVAKYLPEDDRPGILTLASIRDFKFETTVDGEFGFATVVFHNIDFAHVTFPSLMALGVKTVRVHRNHLEELIGEALHAEIDEASPLPMVMARFIGNEMEPTAKIKLNNLRIEYHISTIIAILGYKDTIDGETMVADMVSSVVTLTSRGPHPSSPPRLSTQSSARSDTSLSSKALRIDIALRDSVLGLNPRNSPSKGLVVLTNTHFIGVMPRKREAHATLEIRKASVMVIDDVANVTPANAGPKRQPFHGRRTQVEALSETGYVSVTTISAAKATMELIKAEDDASNRIDIEIKDKLFVLESCADSTQTLQAIVNGLNPPLPPSKELKYRTEVVPVEDMLASFVGDTFATEAAGDGGDDDLPLELDEGDMVEDEVPQNLEFVSSFYNPDPEAASEGIADSMLEDTLESLASPSVVREIGSKNLLKSFEEQAQVAPGNLPLDFQDEHFGSTSTVEGTAHRWNTKHNTYGLNGDYRERASPLRVRVRDVHIIWNLFDGYDWQHTRDVITLAVEEVQNKAAERLSRREKRKSLDLEEEEESVIGDFLFNSIYIGIPANRDPSELARQVNHNLDELASETGSYATSSASGSPSRQGHTPRSKSSKLRLKRSKYHKMAFELKGISADVVVFPPDSGETQSSIDIRVQELEIFDHVPTSTWKKFATYMHDAGERESGTSMVHLEILNVKPVPNLAASEMMLKVRSVVPKRYEG